MISEIDIKDWEPQIEVVTIKENDDGSADCTINMNPAALKFLINFAFVSSLEDALKRGKLMTPGAPE
jgi:hypothetical protein